VRFEMKYLMLYGLPLALLSCQPGSDSIGQEMKLLAVPYGQDPETPSQTMLDSIATMVKDSLKVQMVEIAPDRTQHFYTYHEVPFSGWVKEVFLDSNHRTRYYQIDSGFVNWQIGYFDNGILDCDFHALNGFNHGNQRMWSRDGRPYINTYSIQDQKHGLQQRWHSNGALDWKAIYDHGALIYGVNYNPEGKIYHFAGDFDLPIPDEQEYEEMKLLYSEWNGPWGAYLDYFFKSSSEKNALRIEGGDHICHYKIVFADKITYESNTCSAGSGYGILTLPKTSDASIRKILYAILRPWDENDTYQWSPDTMYYTDEGIPESAGCNVVIEQEESSTIVKLYCSD
jgi:hypothetical protein